jgi:hypothetical protein
MGYVYGRQGNRNQQITCFQKAARLGDEDAQE